LNLELVLELILLLTGPPTSVTYQLPLPGSSREVALPLPDNIAVPHVMFPSEMHELAWLTAQREHRSGEEDLKNVAILPSEEHFFPGSKRRSDFVQHTGMTKEKVNAIWSLQGNHVEERQRALLPDIEQKKRREARAEGDRLKAYQLSVNDRQNDAQETQRAEQEPQQQKRQDARRLREEQRQVAAKLLASLNLTGEANREKRRFFFQERAEAAKKQKLQDKERDEAAKGQRLQDEASKRREFEFRRNTINNMQRYPPVEPRRKPAEPLENNQIRERATNRFQHPASQFRIPELGATPGARRDRQTLDTMAIRRQKYKDKFEQDILQRTAGPSKGSLDYARDERHSTMGKYVGFSASPPVAPTAGPTASPARPAASSAGPAAPQLTGGRAKKHDLDSYLKDLEEAHILGSKARARLRGISWEEYTATEASLSSAAYVARKVRDANITADRMPAQITPGMSAVEVQAEHEKWSRLCNIVIEANDFESQTQVASLYPQEFQTKTGEFYAVF
jgi:hypothetical protein